MKIVHLHQLEKQKINIDGAEKALKQVPLSGKDGAPVYALRDFALVLPDEKHQYRNISEKQNLVIICGVPVEYE